MDSQTSHLTGAPSLSPRDARRAMRAEEITKHDLAAARDVAELRAEGAIVDDDYPALSVRVWQAAAEIRKRRPKGFRDPGRFGQNYPTAELKSEIRDLVRCGRRAKEIARLLSVTPRLVAEVTRAKASVRRCSACGGALEDRFAMFSAGERHALEVLLELWPGGLTDSAWAEACGRGARGGKWRETRLKLVGEGLVERAGRKFYAAALARAACTACAARQWQDRRAA